MSIMQEFEVGKKGDISIILFVFGTSSFAFLISSSEIETFAIDQLCFELMKSSLYVVY